MSTMRREQFYTYEDYCKINDDKRREIINGVIYLMSPGNNRKHQEISGNLYGMFWSYLQGSKCQVFHPPFDVCLPKKGETKLARVSQMKILSIISKNVTPQVQKKRLISQ